jgi:hypothetical protein
VDVDGWVEWEFYSPILFDFLSLSYRKVVEWLAFGGVSNDLLAFLFCVSLLITFNLVEVQYEVFSNRACVMVEIA